MKSKLLIATAVLSQTLFAAEKDNAPSNGQALVENYCVSCHGEKKKKGNIRLDNIGSLPDNARRDLLDNMQEQVFIEEMPPADHSKKMTPSERKQLIDWLTVQLRVFGPSKLEDKLRQPDYANRLEHNKLFSGEFKDLKGFTYDRNWLISEYIFNTKFARILGTKTAAENKGKRVQIQESRPGAPLTNPFALPSGDGVRYYANDAYTGGHFITMTNNARMVADRLFSRSQESKIVGGKEVKINSQLPAIPTLMSQEWSQNNSLNTRVEFLRNHIARIAEEIYQDKNAALLPPFVPVSSNPEPATPAAPEEKNAPQQKGNGKKATASFHYAQLSKPEMIIMARTVRKHQATAKDQADLIDKCEREWFYAGDEPLAISRRLNILKNYYTEFNGNYLTDKGNRPEYKEIEYKPLDPAEMNIIKQTILAQRKPKDKYSDIVNKCAAVWQAEYEKSKSAVGGNEIVQLKSLISELFDLILERQPSDVESAKFVELSLANFKTMSRENGIKDLIQTILLQTEFVYRSEFGVGAPDTFGRKMMSPRDASYALAYALTDNSPDKELAEAARTGKLATREDYKREVTRMLNRRDLYYIIDSATDTKHVNSQTTNLPIRKIRFFREFFGYPELIHIFKDNKRFGSEYTDQARYVLVNETDLWLEQILLQDKDVFKQLLTSDKFYVMHNGNSESMAKTSNAIREIHDYFSTKDWKNFTDKDVVAHREFITKHGLNLHDNAGHLKSMMTNIVELFNKGQKNAPPVIKTGGGSECGEIPRFYNLQIANWDYPINQPTTVPYRKGILTHPAWLIAHAKNTETDPIKRGRWVREKLLAGAIPDVPITVDAVIPEDPHKTLRQRLEARTEDTYCWGCHQRMNPLGLPFEMFDDFGRYRNAEALEYPENIVKKVQYYPNPFADGRDIYKTLPINSKGRLDGTDDPKLDGDVSDALDLIDRLSRSVKVRQSIIRHAFRYFMGRNEVLSDSKTLLDADKAYVDSGGSFDAVIISLLTSDSFIYRKPLEK